MPSAGKHAAGERVRVSDAFDLRMGKTPSRKNPLYWHGGSHDWVSIADLGSFGKYVGETKEQINDLAVRESGIKPAPADTVLMSFKLSLGKTSITTVPVYTNEAIMAFVDKGTHPVCLDFMYHQCRSKDWTAGTNIAVMGKTLNKGSLERATIYLPDLDKQKGIAAKFDSIEGQIAKAEDQIKQLKALVKSRFVEMFGASGPYPSRRLAECVRSIDSGKSPSCLPVARTDDGHAVLKLSALSSGVYLERENKALAIGEAIDSSREVVEGDLLMARKNTPELVGCCVQVDSTGGNIMFPDLVFRMHPVADVDGTYLCAALSGPLAQMIKQMAHGSAKSMSNIPKSGLRELLVPLPPLALQREFAKFVAHVNHLESLARQSIAKLQLLYDSLAQDYFGTPEA